ncbi:MAG: DUF6452 family protein [Polaribacter sp.]
MKKTISLIFLIIIVISACEKDDFCTQNPVTPNLVLRFYDDADRETLKNVNTLYVWAAGKDSIYDGVSTDSIAIPLNSLANETIYNFSDGTTVNTFTIAYTPQEEYVSRSCGFRVVFNDAIFTSNNTWITDFLPSTLTTINSQSSAHVQIFH